MPIVRASEVNGETYTTPSSHRVDALMNPDEFAKRKHELMRALRASGDPPPRRMRTNQHPDPAASYLEAVRQCLSQNEGSTLVRGFRLLTVPLSKKTWGAASAWKASFHAVVQLPPNPDNTDHSALCPYIDPNGAFEGQDTYLFLPSSRIHPELSDAQILSGRWFLGTVVGGCSAFATALRGRRSPPLGEACTSYRSICFAGCRIAGNYWLLPLWWPHGAAREAKPLVFGKSQ